MAKPHAPHGWIPGKEGYRKYQRLFDLALYKRNIRMTCGCCEHSRVIDAPGLWWMFEKRHWNEELRDIGLRFYCGECWKLHRKKVRQPKMEVVEDDAEGPLLPGPDEYEWKRIVNRQRS